MVFRTLSINEIVFKSIQFLTLINQAQALPIAQGQGKGSYSESCFLFLNPQIDPKLYSPNNLIFLQFKLD
ncbi:hypothetical protein P872_07715 [Rhodonellum psychrophilum GCM71 = DSM 17998]|uniref:Uncharacterized protein n=2 Tax=Rhodonellum TaxID=336827 RepID=U5BW59_9BACT|nr:hypothetical protein P872_07715 [Rhodonellum psychrophilum GCM71 = DSM 17998]SDZ28131.1 hypothetical protein SAMN05444412_10957 [Rhodonellum ikkaensis]